MKNAFLLIALFVLCFHAKAQVKLVSCSYGEKESLGLTGLTTGEYLILNSHNHSNQYSLLILHQQRGLILKTDLLRNSLQIRGVATGRDEITIYVSSTGSVGTEWLERITFNKENATFSPAFEVKPVVFPDKLVASFTDGPDFCLVTAQKKAGTVTLERFTGEGPASKKAFTVSDGKLLKALLKKDFTFVPPGQEISLEQAKRQHKVYWREGKLLFTFDGGEGSTGMPETALLTLDAYAGTAVAQRVASEGGGRTKHNSFLCADTLFVLGIDHKALNVSVFSLADLQPLKRFSYQRGEPIRVKATPLLKNGEYAEENWREQEASRKVIKSIASGTPVFNVWAKGNTYQLLLGSYRMARRGGGPMMMPMGGGTLSTPRGSVHVPLTYNMVHYGDGSSQAVYTYFGGVLFRAQLMIAPAEARVESVYARIGRRIQALNKEIKVGGLGTIAAGGGVYLLYLNKKDKYLTIEEFK